MISTKNYIHTTHNQEQIREQGLELFDLVANYTDIQTYIAGFIPPHWHRQMEFFVLLSGRVKIGIRENIYELVPGEGCFINAEVLHSFTACGDSSCYFRSFVFDPTIVSGMPGSIFDVKYVRPLLHSGKDFLKFFPDRDPVYFEKFNQAFQACTEEFTGYEFKVRDCLTDILLYIQSRYPFATDSQPVPGMWEIRVKQMLEWMEQNLRKNISVNDIAASANICPRECQRVFQRYVHYSPMEYLRLKRILLAAELLSTTTSPVIDIALECGFSGSSYFSKQFKLLTGSTPMEYRKAVHSQNIN